MPSLNPPSPDTIRKALNEFQVTVNTYQIAQIQEYTNLLLSWNDKVNLTAIRDPLDILYRHFCESMFATTKVNLENCRLADIGSGGGFPGLALKILLPKATMFLVESNVKKATFLAETVRALELQQTQVLVCRYEELGEEIAPVDFILARALGEFESLLKWAGSERAGVKNAILWLGEKDAIDVAKIAGWSWGEPVPVPQSLRRMILVGTKA